MAAWQPSAVVAAIIDDYNRGGTSYDRGVESMLSMTQDASWAK